jgi:hypothetical protein
MTPAIVGVMTPRKIGSVSKGTTRRSVRIEDELWAAAKRDAETTGQTVSDVIRDALDRRSTIIDAIDELSENLLGVLAERETPGVFGDPPVYADHPLHDWPTEYIDRLRDWLDWEVQSRRREWAEGPK